MQEQSNAFWCTPPILDFKNRAELEKRSTGEIKFDVLDVAAVAAAAVADSFFYDGANDDAAAGSFLEAEVKSMHRSVF